MENKKTALFYVRTALTLCLIAGVMAGLLAGINAFTGNRIENAKMSERKAAIEKIFGESDVLEESLPEDSDECIDSIYAVSSGEALLGYAVYCTPAGYGGKEIEMIVGINGGGAVKEILIIADNQTAGIGDKVNNREWLALFEEKDKDSYNGVDIIAGATKSSAAVDRAVRASLALFPFTEKEGDK